MRHGQKLQMATDHGTLSSMTKDQAPCDAAVANRSAQNLAANASVHRMV